MATIRIAQSKDWTGDLDRMLASAGHEVISEGTAQIAFTDAVGGEDFDNAATIIVAPLDQVSDAVAKTKGGEAYAFVRYPFVDDEVEILISRALDHLRLQRELQQLRQPHHGGEGNGESTEAASEADPVAAARNLAGKPLADIEKQVILSTLEQFKGHRVRTATALGIGVRTLGMKLKRWREEGEPIVSRSTNNVRPVEHAGA